jgi:hypothetical protein
VHTSRTFMNAPTESKQISFVAVSPPPESERARRPMRAATENEKRTRYHLPVLLDSASPVGFRTRVNLRPDETEIALAMLSLPRPTVFIDGPAVHERELFEESSLGVLVARQSTNFRGQSSVILGPTDSAKAAAFLRRIGRTEAQVLDGAAYTHVILARPYVTAFTKLLTFIGHTAVANLVTVPWRAYRKAVHHVTDIPTIQYLTEIHLGVLADSVERAAIVASEGKRRAQVFIEPMDVPRDPKALVELEGLVGLTDAMKREGWRIQVVAQVGYAPEEEAIALTRDTARRLGAAFLALRSERIQPGVNAEESAPGAYQQRQSMDVPEGLTVMAGRAAYNAFAHYLGTSRERAKELLLLERMDVLTPGGKERLRSVRKQLEDITDKIVKNIPLWADLMSGRALSSNTARGKKAFALAGQRIYLGGLSRTEIERDGRSFRHAVRAFGAAAARSALVVELAGSTDVPKDCDLLAGVCLMAGPVNQNDIGKSFFGYKDLLSERFPDRDPTSLLVWTLKAKTVADPIGNEEQLLNRARKGALVDLRAAPHEVVSLRIGNTIIPMRRDGIRVNQERAFGDVGNFAVSDDQQDIPGNRGVAWPEALREVCVWENEARS